MSRKTIITGALVALVSLALLTTVAVAGRGDGAGFARTGGMDRAACRMGDRGMRPSFTTEQKEQMKKIREGFEDERVELQNKMKVLHLEMQELVSSDDPDFGKLERMIDDVAELRAETMKLKLKQHRAIREILDDDQRVLFDRGIARMLADGGHGRGMRGGRQCGPANCGPMSGQMQMGRRGMMGGRGMMGCTPADVEKCVIMMKGEPGEMGEPMSWETEDGERIEIFQVPGGGRGERRIIVEKIIDDDDIEADDED